MECPECQLENKEGARFCNECGHKFEQVCPECGVGNRLGSKFCNECGFNFVDAKEVMDKTPDEEDLSPAFPDDNVCLDSGPIVGERKYVTVLFSDITGYTSMSEKLDPEEVKEVTTQIFDEISKIVGNYDGFIEKFAGDAVMAMFGATTSHEDDPMRAIRAAMEIHNAVNQLSPRYEEITEQPLSMHTGINTGLVVTGDINLEKGTHGVAGDTLNVAARLSSIGNADDIMVGHDTFCQVEGFFNFKALKPAKVKGKTKPVRIYKVLSLNEQPRKVHRLQGVRAELIGRVAEMRQLKTAVERFKQGKGTIISISGAAGTGKSRLIEEFKASLNLKEIQWREGHAYPYSEGISYAPFIDILDRAFRIKDGDSTDTIKEKFEKGIEYLDGNKEDIIPYVGSLYEIRYPEIEEISPEFWKSGLQKAMQGIVLGLTRKGPTIFCFEDLHWADPSSIDLLHYLFSNFSYPAIFLCVYRPVFNLFTSHQINSIGKAYEEINLLGLSTTEVHNMVESLLKTESIPFELKGFAHKKVEGNPFFLEELINSLIESETLMQENGTWKLIKPISASEVPATIQGVLSARFDRLESEKKRVLQEASVIGRAFFYDILKKVTNIKDQYDQCLSALEHLDLVRTKSLKPDLEYIFKHALTQEVVYNGLLKKERRMLHEKIGLVMEQLFQDRLPEFYETLAFHFKKGQSLIKAIAYLMKSGEKSLKRYALEEAHQSYKEAFDILTGKPDKSMEEKELLIDLLIKWAYVYYYRGYFAELVDLYRTHESLAESINDKVKLGMFNGWFGFFLFMYGEGKVAYQHLNKALELGKESGNQPVIGYAYCWLSWSCWDMGFLKEGINYAKKAHDIAKTIESDQYLYFKSLGSIGTISLLTGDSEKAFAVGKEKLEYGQRHSNARCITFGYLSIAAGHMINDDYESTCESYQMALESSADPVYREYARNFWGYVYLFKGQIQEAEELLKASLSQTIKFGYGVARTFANAFLGAVNILRGKVDKGIAELEKEIKDAEGKDRLSACLFFEFTLGFVCLQKLMEGESPSFGEKAEDHLTEAAELAKRIGAKFVLGNASLSLGFVYSIRGKFDKARTWASEAVQVFEELEIDSLLKQAEDLLKSLG